MNEWIVITPVLVPILSALILGSMKSMKTRRIRDAFFMTALTTEVILILYMTWNGMKSLEVFSLFEGIPILFHNDKLGTFFSILVVSIWWISGYYSLEYMKEEGGEQRYDVIYLIAEGVLVALCYAGNLVTLYFCFESMTLSTMPLVLHEKTREAVRAARKYMFYSIFGASMALGGIVLLWVYAPSITFQAGGVFTSQTFFARESLYLTTAAIMILGFCGKAGMYPLHGWLPTAHPQAPAPASAVMSGIITKMGVLAVIRVVFYIFGAEQLRGTWVQTAWMSLAILTIFMGSMMAWKEPLMKRRFAYSTVSQVSYILLGLSTLNVEGVTGGMLHIVFHATAKMALFLMSGIVIYYTGKKRVKELDGVCKQMPVVMIGYTIASLALVGIPPFSGFISKEFLAHGVLSAGMGGIGIVAVIVLLASAILTAGYLLPITLSGFYTEQKTEKISVALCMKVPMLLLGIATVVFGLFPTGLMHFFETLIHSWM